MRIVFLFLLLQCPLFGDSRSDAIREILDVAEFNPLSPEKVAPEIREEIIIQLRSRMTEYDLTHWGRNCDALVRLGDEQTIAEAMKAKSASNEKQGKGILHPSAMEESGQILLVPYLAKDFFREDGEDVTLERDDDLRWFMFPISIASSCCALEILQRSDELSPEVKKWAKEAPQELGTIISGKPDPTGIPKLRNLMRQWWRENEKHFAAKDYAAVKPGALLERTVQSVTGELQPASQPPLAAPLSGTPTPTTAVISDTQSSPYIIPAAVGFSVLAIAAAAVISRRKKSK